MGIAGAMNHTADTSAGCGQRRLVSEISKHCMRAAIPAPNQHMTVITALGQRGQYPAPDETGAAGNQIAIGSARAR